MGTRRKLADRYERFCREYVIDFHGTRAAIAAGYAESGAHVEASRLLKNPKIEKRINELHAARCQKADVTAERIVQRLANLAFFDSRRLYREDGSLKPPHELDAETADALAGFEVKEIYDNEGAEIGTLKKVRLLDRGSNLERLGKTMALFKDNVQHGPVEVRVTIEAVGNRNGHGG